MATAADTSNTEDTLVLSPRVLTPDELAFEEEVDRALETRERLQAAIRRLEGYTGNVPSEVALQEVGLIELRSQLAEAEQAISVMRGDFGDDGPKTRPRVQDRGEARARRIFELRPEYERRHGRGWRAKLAADEGCSESNIKRLLTSGKKFAMQDKPPQQRRASGTK